MALMRDRASENYRWEMLQFSVLRPHMKDANVKPPELPAVLKD